MENKNITPSESSEFLWALFNNIPSAIFVIDKNNKIHFFNDAFKNLFEADEFNSINKLCGEVIGCEFQLKEGQICGHTSACEKCAFRNNFIKGFIGDKVLKEKISREFEIKNIKTKKHFTFINKLVHYKNEEMQLVIIDDITEQVEQRKKLEELLKFKNEIIQIAAHDIRNPITAIYSFADVLLDKSNAYSPEKTTEFINIIKDSSKFSIELLNDLLDFSTLEAEESRLRLAEVEYTAFLKSIIEINQVIANKKSIKLDLICNCTPIKLLIDQNKIEQVINNLLSNAIKFSNNNSKIEIYCHFFNDTILTKVKDFGPGIANNEINNLFKPFNRGSAVPTGNEKSTGLGLVISKKIIKAHNGNIWVESKTGKGAEFIFTIPIQSILSK